MIFQCTTEGVPIQEVHMTFNKEGLAFFLSELSSEHIWWPIVPNATEEEVMHPRQIHALDVFCDDGSFPLLKEYPLVIVLEPGDDCPCRRVSLIGTKEAYEQHLHAPIRHMLKHGTACSVLPHAMLWPSPSEAKIPLGHPVALHFTLVARMRAAI